jgi:hypothetical protein
MSYLDNIARLRTRRGTRQSFRRRTRPAGFPAVASNRIKELEKHLGVSLFNRTTRQLMPTEHGNVFLFRVR